MRTFLGILNREEADYRRRIELKYQIRKREILRLMNLRTKCQQRGNGTLPAPPATDKNDDAATLSTPSREANSATSPPAGEFLLFS